VEFTGILLVIRYSDTQGTRKLANNSTRNTSFCEILSEIESHNKSLQPGSKFISKILGMTFGRASYGGFDAVMADFPNSEICPTA